MKQSTAILLFSRSASAEAKNALTLKGVDRQVVVTQLIRKAEKLARQSDLPLFRSNERNQHSTTFGQNLSAAVGEVFAAGYTQVLVMGNDCPQLRLSDLRKCEKKLNAGQTVLGPDLRGGAYLLGIRKDNFDQRRFAALSWQSTSLWSDLQELFPSAFQLRSLRDVNKGEDLLALLDFLRANRHFARLAQLVTGILPPLFQLKRRLRSLFYRAATSLRGPPQLA